MRRQLILVGTALMCITIGQLYAAPWDTVVFEDSFTGPDGNPPDPSKWTIGRPEVPSGWVVQGRSFIPTPSQHAGAPFPHLEDNACVIEHYQYNPFHLGTPKTTFLGGEIRSTMQFDPTQCYRFEARVKWPTCPGGLVSSFFTYGYDEANQDSDEIDFEFLSNEVFDTDHNVHTVPWDDSVQWPLQVSIPELDLTQWQVFRIYWCPSSHVEWTWIEPGGDERSLRKESLNCVPDESMMLYFNFWAATTGWPKAYDTNLQPDQQDNGVSYDYWIDYVEVRVPEPATCLLLAVSFVCLTRRRH